MLTNIPLLFILTLIIIFSFSQEQSTDDACSKDEAISRNDCFARSVPNSYCCFDYSQSKKCKSIPKKELDNHPELDCGITEDNYGKYEFGQYHPDQSETLKKLGFETCGKSSPKKKQDCTDFSEISNSCCLFTKKDEKACLHIGRKYYGNSKSSSFTLDGDSITVECNSFNLIFNLYLFLLITLFL